MPNQQSGTPVRWGMRDALLWLAIAQLGSVIWFGVVLLLVHDGDQPDPVPLSTRLLVQLAFVFAYGFGPWIVSRRKGNGPVLDYGARFERFDVPVGVLLGLLTQLVVLPVLYFPILRFVDEDPSDAARRLTDLVDTPVDTFLLVLMAVVLAPAVEEFFFRGLLLRSLEQIMGLWPAVAVQAGVFAAVHFQLLQFPGLLVFGLISGALAAVTGRLGPSWALHVAFNAATVVLLLT